MSTLLKLAKKKTRVKKEQEDVDEQARELGEALNKKKKGETKTNREIDEEKEDVDDQQDELGEALAKHKKRKTKQASLVRNGLSKNPWLNHVKEAKKEEGNKKKKGLGQYMAEGAAKGAGVGAGVGAVGGGGAAYSGARFDRKHVTGDFHGRTPDSAIGAMGAISGSAAGAGVGSIVGAGKGAYNYYKQNKKNK